MVLCKAGSAFNEDWVRYYAPACSPCILVSAGRGSCYWLTGFDPLQTFDKDDESEKAYLYRSRPKFGQQTTVRSDSCFSISTPSLSARLSFS